MNSKNQVALHYKLPEPHSRNQSAIFVYTMTPKSLLIMSFYYYCLKKPLYLQNYLKFIFMAEQRERAASTELLTSICNICLLTISTVVTELENQLQKFAFAERSLLHLSYWPCSTMYQSQLWWYARYPCTLSLEFSEDIRHAQDVHRSWGWLFLWRNCQNDHKSNMFRLRPHDGFPANYVQDR